MAYGREVEVAGHDLRALLILECAGERIDGGRHGKGDCDLGRLGVDQPGELDPQVLQVPDPDLPGIAVPVPGLDEFLQRPFDRPRQRALRAAAQVHLLVENGKLSAERRDAVVLDGWARHFWHSSGVSRSMISRKSGLFTESVIREMTRLCIAEHGANCLNLAQGFPDFAAPAELKEAAVDAIRKDFNQYATTWGAKVMRDAIAAKTQHFRQMTVDPETEITVCCGVTEAMLSTILALVDPGDEVIIFEPFYENYGPDCILSGATPVVVPLVPPDWHFDRDQLRKAFNARTRAIIINTPHNPTGKVYSREELTFIAGLCQEFDVLAITDEI